MNKAGLQKGVDARCLNGIITIAQGIDLIKLIDEAEPNMFRPVLYVIVKERVSTPIMEASINVGAANTSKEF